jgi:hypothetical protein
MPTRKSPTSAEKKPATRKAPARKTVEPAVTPAIEKQAPSYQDVAQLAEQFWVERGRPFGSPEIDWVRAEATLHTA